VPTYDLSPRQSYAHQAAEGGQPRISPRRMYVISRRLAKKHATWDAAPLVSKALSFRKGASVKTLPATLTDVPLVGGLGAEPSTCPQPAPHVLDLTSNSERESLISSSSDDQESNPPEIPEVTECPLRLASESSRGSHDAGKPSPRVSFSPRSPRASRKGPRRRTTGAVGRRDSEAGGRKLDPRRMRSYASGSQFTRAVSVPELWDGLSSMEFKRQATIESKESHDLEVGLDDLEEQSLGSEEEEDEDEDEEGEEEEEEDGSRSEEGSGHSGSSLASSSPGSSSEDSGGSDPPGPMRRTATEHVRSVPALRLAET